MEYTDPESIIVLKGLEGVRRRPGMYIGGVDAAALHRMLTDLLGVSVQAHHQAGASYVRVTPDGAAIAIEHDGAGIPAQAAGPTPGAPALESAMTALHGGGWTGARRGRTPPPWWCDGSYPVANALSERLDVDVWGDGRHHQLSCARGVALGPVRDLGATDRTGMRITLLPDFSIFEPCGWDRAWIARRLRELAALHPRLTAICDHDAVRCPDGLVDLARYLARDAVAIAAPLAITGVRDDVAVDAALLWTTAARPRIRGFVGDRPVRSGTHLRGLADGLLGGFTAVDAARFGRVHPDAFGELIGRGLVAVVRVQLDDPRYRWRDHLWLTSAEAQPAVAGVVADAVQRRLRDDPALRDALIARLPR